jgi:hypothetical protein
VQGQTAIAEAIRDGGEILRQLRKKERVIATEKADSLGYRRLTLHRTFVPESQPATLARRIMRSCQQRQGRR